jgi:predicted DCC family thiol-disulfide oxidoreductase YuxK
MWVQISYYRLLPIGLLRSVAVAQVLAAADIALIVLGIVGFYTRSSIGLATLISLYAFGLMENIGKVDHFQHIIWFMALLAAGPSGCFLSIDALRRTITRANEGSIEAPIPSSAGLWTLRYTWLMMGALYLPVGIAKLQSSLADHWAGPANLRNIMWRTWLAWYWYDPHFGRPVRADSLPAVVLAILGVSVVVFEVGFIVAVFFRRTRPVWTLWGIAFHVGNGLVLRIWFTTLMAAYVSLFDWVAIGRSFTRRGSDPLLVFYDQRCQFCRRTVAILRLFDLFGTLKPVANISRDPVRERYPQISDEMLAADLYAVDGVRIMRGYEAYIWIAKRTLLFWPIGAILQFSLLAVLGRRFYRRMSDSRHCRLTIRQEKEKAAPIRRQFGLIHRVGPALFACELAISSCMLLYHFPEIYMPASLPMLKTARRLVYDIGKRRPVWPFDLYPTFTPAMRPDIEVWEARWVTLGGNEIRISPTAYYDLFGNAGITWNVTSREILRATNSEQGQASSLNLVQLLWQHELPNIRRNVIAVNVYRAEYRLQPPTGQFPAMLLAQRILYTFPLSKIVDNPVPRKILTGEQE